MYVLLLFVTLGLNLSSDILDRRISGGSNVAALSAWTAIIQLLLIIPFVGLVDIPSLQSIGVLLVVGAFSTYARGRWYKALSNPAEKLSRFAPFVRLSSVIVLVVAVTLLGESMSPTAVFGAALMLAAGFVISLERAHTGLREFLHANRVFGLILVFACSNALITISYKYLLGQGVTILSIYFLLKLFPCTPLLVGAIGDHSFMNGYRQIRNIRLFVASRALQTVAALMFLLVLRNLDLTTVEPVVAMTPLVYVVWEAAEKRWLKHAAPAPAVPLTRFKRLLHPAAIALSIAGFMLIQYR